MLAGGVAHVAGTPTQSVTIAELAGSGGDQLVASGSGEPEPYPEVEARCVGDHYVGAWVAPQFSCHAAHVRVDRDTGVARVLRVGAAHDSGTIIHPMGALGQIEGGVMMGIGQALTEITRYDDQGNQRNAGLLEYKLQTAADLPEVSVTFIDPGEGGIGPRGSKGLAEAPNVTTAAAINNAITKVIGSPVRQLPMTAERVWSVANGIEAAQ